MNRATLIGHVGKDPEIRVTSSGKKVANFSLATSERWKDRETGERKERSQWHNIVVWNEGLAGVVERYVKKGSRLFIEGEIQTRDYEKDGGKRFITEIVLQGFNATLTMLDGPSKSKDDDLNSDGGFGSERSDTKPARKQSFDKSLDSEIPF